MTRNPLQGKLAAVVLAVLAIALAVPALADDTTPPPNGPAADLHAWYILSHPRALAVYLGLSADQVNQAKPLWAALHTANQPLHAQRPALCTSFETALGANPPDPAAVGAAASDLFDNKQAIKANRATFDTSFGALLNSTQLARYEALKELALAEDPYYSPIGQCPRS